MLLKDLLKKKVSKYPTSISENVCIEALDDTVNKYSNTYPRTVKIKPVDVTSGIYIDLKKESNKEGLLNLKLTIM